ncbi:MAG: hypothetical protein JJ885_07915 [Muricauda sp.]|nr:hypothetical protein [Allomuricauda sp.]MBO6531634.1 hypothetical protein [Allomuricauda sp.]MBO6619441.1 hypothetical protein [Allomuricauda sp.]MBO6645352.1 hypothetical protein [Allomuricauda sp.]MBO6747372.1 hypothetical protein [Allomuricauda sp.]MBO6844259.1 hypothetical protein [Allomuricauda sp.]
MSKKIILLCLCLLICSQWSMAHLPSVKDSITRPESTHKKPISRQFFAEFNNQTVEYSTFVPPQSEFDHDYVLQNFAVDSITSDQLNQARSVIQILEENQNYVNLIAPNDLVSLPIGVKTQIGTITYTLAISNAKITRDYAEVTAFVHIRIPQTDNNGEAIELFFGANNIKISHQGGIYGDANLVLLGDIGIPISGGNGLVALKGGLDMGTGNVQNRTYVTIDCGGFREMGVTADVLFPRSMLQPVDANYQVIPDENVKGSFQTIVGDWNDILVEIDLPAFQLSKPSAGDDSGKAGLIFDINTAVFDFSDIRNSSSVQFPDGYQQYLIPGNEQLWRGVYVNTLQVILPEQFKRRGSDERISFQATNLLIDGIGVSGNFAADNVLPIHEGDASKWQFSVDHIEADLLANQIVGAGFDGKIVLPVTKEITEEEGADGSVVDQRTLRYEAIIDPVNDEYVLSARTEDAIPFDVFKATATITPNSYVELRVSEKRFRPRAVLHGNLAIKGSNSTSDPNKGTVDFKGITFQNLQLQTVSPYFQVDHMGYTGDVTFANFPVTISDIYFNAGPTSAALTFNLDVNMMEKGFAGNTTLSIIGGFNENEGLHRWRFQKLELHDIYVQADLGTIQIDGMVSIKSDDPIYGDGFYGDLGATFNGINVDASAWFGKTEFRYWFVDAYVDLSNALTPSYIGPAKVNGLGGGAYYKMSKKPGEYSAMIPSGQSYIPNANNGLGFRALVGFALTNEKAFNGKVGFEMDFNTNYGLNRIMFFGEAHIVKALDFEFGDKFKDKLRGMEEKINSFGENNPTMKQLKETNLVNYSKQSFPQDGLTFDVGIDAHFAMEMDFQHKTFHAELEIYVNTPGGFFQGVGPRGRAGWAVFHAAPEEWYLHVGTPQDRIGLKLGLGSFSLSSTSYLMIGEDLPGSPPPPAIVADILGVDLASLDYMRDLNALESGMGFAFGADFSIDTGDMTFLIFYARFQAGLGFDIMIKDYGETACKGSGQIGIDGWYANGQAYAYLQGELGINIRLMFVRKKIPIIKAGAAVLLQAKLPNPAWFKGYLGGHFNLLGGLVKGRFRFKIELGEECEIVGGAPLGGLKVISTVTPNNGSSEMDVFTVPQAAFNMRINHPFELEDDEGVKTYRILLDEFRVTSNGNTIPGELKWNENNDLANFVSHDILPPHSPIQVKVAVSFQERRGSNWITLTDQGKPAKEMEERSFTTGEAPDHIPISNVVYAYPVVDQQYFYQNERRSGYVKLERGQPYLFSPETDWVQYTRFESESHSVGGAGVSYHGSNKMVRFDFPTLQNQHTYTFKLLSASPEEVTAGSTSENYVAQDTGQEGNSVAIRNREITTTAQIAEETEVLVYEFTTSSYNYFKDKILAKSTTGTVKEIIFSNVHALQVDVNSSEKFSLEEILGHEFNGNKPMMVLEAVLDDNYYRNVIHPLIYEDYPIQPQITVSRDVSDLGIPPKRALDLISWYPTYLQNNPNHSLLNVRFPYRYNLPYYYNKDFKEIQYKLINGYLSNTPNQDFHIEDYHNIINGVFPFIPKGNYKVRVKYMLPGNINGSSAIFKYDNPFN